MEVFCEKVKDLCQLEVEEYTFYPLMLQEYIDGITHMIWGSTIFSETHHCRHHGMRPGLPTVPVKMIADKQSARSLSGGSNVVLIEKYHDVSGCE